MRAPPHRLLSAAAVIAATCAAVPAMAEEAVSVITDRAKVFRIEQPADTIIIGNPAIADVTMHDRTTLVITGKSYGTTNLVILNAAGDPIIDEVISVEPPASSVVTLTRSTQSYSFGCTPHCQPFLNIGDQKDHFDDTFKQITQRKGLSEGAGAQPQ